MTLIRVPATSANIGAGFDCMGLALTLYNEIRYSVSKKLIIHTDKFLPSDKTNLVAVAMQRVFDEYGRAPVPVELWQQNGIPCTSGLGSSAACAVGGVLAGLDLLGVSASADDVVRLCTALDGHPDNVVPALRGGVTCSVVEADGTVFVTKAAKKPQFAVALMTPEFTLSTSKSRAVLPAQYPRADLVYSVSRAAATFAALCESDLPALSHVLDDKIHQPYRIPLIPRYEEVKRFLLGQGAAAVYLSGAGPTIAGIVPTGFSTKSALGGWTLRVADVDTAGATVTKTE